MPYDPIERWEWEGGFVPTELDRGADGPRVQDTPLPFRAGTKLSAPDPPTSEAEPPRRPARPGRMPPRRP